MILQGDDAIVKQNSRSLDRDFTSLIVTQKRTCSRGDFDILHLQKFPTQSVGGLSSFSYIWRSYESCSKISPCLVNSNPWKPTPYWFICLHMQKCTRRFLTTCGGFRTVVILQMSFLCIGGQKDGEDVIRGPLNHTKLRGHFLGRPQTRGTRFSEAEQNFH